MDIVFVSVPLGSDLVEFVEHVDGCIALVCSVRATPCGRFVAVATTDEFQTIKYLTDDGFDLEDIS